MIIHSRNEYRLFIFFFFCNIAHFTGEIPPFSTKLSIFHCTFQLFTGEPSTCRGILLSGIFHQFIFLRVVIVADDVPSVFHIDQWLFYFRCQFACHEIYIVQENVYIQYRFSYFIWNFLQWIHTWVHHLNVLYTYLAYH